MKTRQFAAALFATVFSFAGSAAFAGDQLQSEIGEGWMQHITSTKTRAQVIAELNDARAQGVTVGASETSYPQVPVAKSTRSRDEVRAEAINAMKNPVRGVEYTGA
ncbi:MAG TPA: DUF4148 domain-containing protein [Noviherbaspirillum sp.]